MTETARLRELISRHAGKGLTPTALPGISLLRATAVTEPLGEVAEPAVAVIAQGAKDIALNGRVSSHGAGQLAIIPVELPVTGHITLASPSAPLLAFVLMLRQEKIAALLAELSHTVTPSLRAAAVPAGITVSDASPAVLDAISRLLALLNEPAAAPVLADGIEREILWRLLDGPQGMTVRQIGLADSRLAHLARAVTFIRAHYDQTLLADPGDIAGAGHAVGYGSPSQFSREYRRMFGAPPSRHAPALRGQSPPLPARNH
jgi:AraC-like DNA-binding protein